MDEIVRDILRKELYEIDRLIEREEKIIEGYEVRIARSRAFIASHAPRALAIHAELGEEEDVETSPDP